MKLRKSFEHLHQRVFYNCSLCLSPFQPVDNPTVSREAQEQMWQLCSKIISTLYEKPELMSIPCEPDDCYQLFVCNNRKPELIKSFRKTAESMKKLYTFLCDAALKGEISGDILTVELDKKRLKNAKIASGFLPHIGMDIDIDKMIVTLTGTAYPEIFPAMKLLAQSHTEDGEITDKTLFGFAMGLFVKDTHYLIEMIEREMEIESGFFAPYFQQMLDMGYTPLQEYGWGTEGPYFLFTFDNGVSGVHICFDMRKIHQIRFELGSQIGVKAICEDYDNQPEHIKAYLQNRLTDCNNCMGCTKGGKNAKFAVKVDVGNGNIRMLCPHSIWIGFQVEYMNHDMMKQLIDFSALQAKYGVNWRKK